MLNNTVMDYALRAAVVTGTEDAALDRLLADVAPPTLVGRSANGMAEQREREEWDVKNTCDRFE